MIFSIFFAQEEEVDTAVEQAGVSIIIFTLISDFISFKFFHLS